MRNRTWTAAVIAAICSIFALTFALPAAFAADIPTAKGWDAFKAQKVKEGWQEIATGVLERKLGSGKVEHLGVGREGLAFNLTSMMQQLDNLKAEYASYPSEQLARTIDELALAIATARIELPGVPLLAQADFSRIAGPSCSSICYSATADAYPLTATQGVGAVASASFNSTCGYTGNTYAYAYARATLGTTTTIVSQADPKSGAAINSSASATVNGGSTPTTPCYSEANSYAQSSTLGISYSTSDTNSTCPAPINPTVTILGSTYEYFSGTGCRNVTWTSSVSPTGSYSYQWTYNGTPVGTASSYTRSVCSGNYTFTLGLTASNGTGSGSDTHTVLVEKEAVIPCAAIICP